MQKRVLIKEVSVDVDTKKSCVDLVVHVINGCTNLQQDINNSDSDNSNSTEDEDRDSDSSDEYLETEIITDQVVFYL